MKAYSLIEFLLASSIALAMLLGGSQLLMSICHATLAHYKLSHESAQLKRAQGFVAIATMENDAHRLENLLQVLPYTAYDNLKNPPKNPLHQPKLRSEYLYSLQLEPEQRFIVKEKERDGSSRNIVAQVCRKSPGNKQVFSDYALAVGLHTQSCVRISPTKYPRTCDRLALAPFPCFAATSSIDFDAFDTHLLIPIRREYLLLMSTEGVLRYIGLEGLFVVENQPLVDSLSEVSFSFSPLSHDTRFQVLQAEFTTKNGRAFVLSHHLHTSKISPLEYISYALLEE